MLLQTVIDFFHLLATVAWIGGAIFMNLVLTPALNAIDPPARGKLMAAISKRFTIIAWSSIVVLAITGYQKTPPGMLFDTTVDYGITLTIKHVLFLALIVIASFIMFVFVPKINALAPKPGERPSEEFLQAQKMVPRLSLTGLFLGIAVLLCVVWLKV